ncbi:MAG: N-acetyl sugar amidotransferase [Campylobacteraceae bacterium]|nr:N-acetyl sugar amidotransferase [Campylobacteraceae bacterium]
MKVCKRCLYSEGHALNLTFDKEGICSGCRVHEEKDSIDWIEREKKLLKLLDFYRAKTKKNYDCIIPISGGKDSYFIVDLIKNKYKMRPLLVAYNKQYNTKMGIRNLNYLKTIFQCDCIENTINPNLSKKITRYTLDKIGSIYWYNHLGTTTFPVQVAAKYKIPLIIWGAHQGIDQVGMFSHTDEVEMTRKYRKEHDLMGYEAEDMISEKDELYERDMSKLFYPSNKDIETIGIRGIYLNNYIRWDSKLQHEEMIKKYNYETMQQTRTFNTYDNVDCFMYSDLHDYIKYIKLGYGKVTDHVSREIRLNHLSREEGLKIVEKYQYNFPKYLNMFLEWLEISEKEFFKKLEKFNKLKKEDINKLEKRVLFNENIHSRDLLYTNNEKFIINSRTNCIDDKILLFDKGYINNIKGN